MEELLKINKRGSRPRMYLPTKTEKIKPLSQDHNKEDPKEDSERGDKPASYMWGGPHMGRCRGWTRTCHPYNGGGRFLHILRSDD